MRVDQYLWCIRIFKSRNIASNACKKGHVQLNGQISKASREILPLDKLEINELQVLSVKISRDQGSGRPTKKERRDIDDLKLSSNEEDL